MNVSDTIEPPVWVKYLIDKIDNICERLDAIETSIGNIKDSTNHIDNIETSIKNIKDSTKHMDNHIEFVETIYDNIKMPFHYIIDKLTPIAYIDTISFIEYNKY